MKQTGFRSPECDSPFEYTFQTKLWSYLATNPELQAGMMDYMAGRRKGGIRWVDIFLLTSQVNEVSKGDHNFVLFVDIGGNQGHDSRLLKERYPEVAGRLIVQDLPHTVNNIKGEIEGVEFMAYDFFTPQPVKGAQFYFYRGICHDWSDKECQKFLGNTVEAMDEHSRLLINEFVLPDNGCDLHPALLDLMMMSLCAGIERSEKQWRALLESVGLEIIKIWSTDGVEAVIEAKKKA